jgi:tRNA modification GTPase
LESHKIYYGFLKSVEGGEPLDEVLLSYFAEGRSFTGEATFEISCHGGAQVADEVLRHLVMAGARPARRGEFTSRAFLNGRIDLVQAESVLELIESRSSRATQLALRQLRGEFSDRLKELLDQLTWILAHLEANIDFASEDIEIASTQMLAARAEKLLSSVREILAGYRRGMIVRNGYHVALVGRPNAGKSSLLNALAGEERAIVTPVAGTTRDFVEAEFSEDGHRLTLVDTAGLRRSDDPVEQIGVARTLEKIKDFDLILYVTDAVHWEQEDQEFLNQVPWDKAVVVVNKIDLHPTVNWSGRMPDAALATLPVSATTKEGLGQLRSWLKARLQLEVAEDSALLSNARHHQGLEVVRESLERSLPLILKGASPDLIALELQGGLQALHEVLGIVFDDQVMDRVFNEFCLGK